MAYVIAPSLWWPHQSVVGDVLQFIALNTNWRDFKPAAPRSAPQVGGEWGRLGLKANSRLHKGILECMHGGLPPTHRWVDHTWVPKLLGTHSNSISCEPLRVCRRCLAVGFHSPIQQLPWIVRCPLHPTESLASCKHDGQGASLWFGALRCNTCRLSLPSPVALAMRGPPNALGIRIIDRYLEFMAACEPLSRVEVWRFVRLPERAPAHHLVSDDPGRFHSGSHAPGKYASQAVRVLAQELGFSDLLGCIMQSRVKSRRVYVADSRSDTSEHPQAPRPFGVLQAMIATGATERAVGDVMAEHFGEFLDAMQCRKRENRLPRIDDYFVSHLTHRRLQQRGPLCAGAPQWVRRCFRAAIGLVGRALVAHAGCREPLQHLSGSEWEEPCCQVCAVAFQWRRAIEQGYAFDEPWLHHGSGTFPCIVDLPPSSAVQRIRRQLLLRDMLALFAAIAKLRSLGRIPVSSSEAQDCLHDMLVLHQGFLGVESAEGVRFMAWNSPDVGMVIRRLGLACTCLPERGDVSPVSAPIGTGASQRAISRRPPSLASRSSPAR